MITDLTDTATTIKQRRIKLGAKLRQLRFDKGYSQEAIAEDIGVATSTISSWEKGDRSMTIDHLFLLSDYFGVEPKRLLDGEG